MGAYMLRRRNLSLAEYNDAAYPLNVAAAALNFSYAKGRRVIHPRRAHLAVAAAAERDRAPLYAALARAYFEEGEDISDVAVLLRVAAALGVERDELRLRRAMDGEGTLDGQHAHSSLFRLALERARNPLSPAVFKPCARHS
jgi:predicted DsbA family dithiol-disulfide isomerase